MADCCVESKDRKGRCVGEIGGEEDMETPSIQDIEQRLLERMEQGTLPIEAVEEDLAALAEAGKPEEADSLSALVEDALAERGRGDDLLRLLLRRADRLADDRAFRAHCETVLQAAFRKDVVGRKHLGHAGFETGRPLKECLHRLMFLRRLAPGMFFLEKTWGFGVVREVDHYYERVTVDFSRKKGHEMAFAYALESLHPVSEDHFCVRWHKDPESLTALVRDRPDEIVKLALRSFGAMSVPRLQELLCEGIVKPDEWKRFWDAARKALKNDPLVRIPARRSDAVELLAKAPGFDAEWFSALAAERLPERVLERLETLEAAVAPDALGDAERATIARRLTYVLSASERDLGWTARGLLQVYQWGVADDVSAGSERLRRFFDPGTLAAAGRELAPRRFRRFLELLFRSDAEAAMSAVAGTLPLANMTLYNELMEFAERAGQGERCWKVIREHWAARRPTVEMLYSLARRPAAITEQGVGTPADLPFLVLDCLEGSFSGDRLRAANQLAELCVQRDWLQAVLPLLTPLQREEMLRRVRQKAGRLALDAQTLTGRMVALCPELSRLLEDASGADDAAAVRFTSWRTYREKQRQLERLVNEEIPQNSRDIAHARSYGDLSENFEYKAAKDMQRILMRRQEELEEALKTVRGTDFERDHTETAGMGTTVTVEGADGQSEVYVILGVWDQDPERHIVSCESEVGRRLTGRRQGDEVILPGEAGERKCRVRRVEGLSDEIRAWARGQNNMA